MPRVIIIGDYSYSVDDSISFILTTMMIKREDVWWLSNTPLPLTGYQYNNVIILADDKNAISNFIQSKNFDIDDCLFVKGQIQTSQYMRYLLPLVKKDTFLSHIAEVYMDSLEYPSSFIMTDGALNIEPTKEQLIKIIKNARNYYMDSYKGEPSIALISADPLNTKLKETQVNNDIIENKNQYGLNNYRLSSRSLDTCFDSHNFYSKYSNGEYNTANIIVFPNLMTANCVWKALELAKPDIVVNGYIIGSKLKIVLNSRNDSSISKRSSIAIALGSMI